MAHSYPIFLSLENADCLVVGLGDVGCRKLTSVLQAGIRHAMALDLRSPEELGPKAQPLLESDRVDFEQRHWRPKDALDKLLVFACTGDCCENDRLAVFCRENNILCNNITAPQEGNFIVPALASQNGVNIALSTGGQSPFLARRWRKELEMWLAPKCRIARILGRLRGPVLALGLSQEQNKHLFEVMADPVMEERLSRGDWKAAEQWLLEHAPGELHQEIKQIFMEPCFQLKV